MGILLSASDDSPDRPLDEIKEKSTEDQLMGKVSRTMKFGLQTWGSDGDIMPFIALAIGLRQSGHDVTVVYTSIDNKDYSFFAVIHDTCIIKSGTRFDVDLTKFYAKIIGSKNPYRDVALFMKSYFDPAVDDMYAAARKLCRESDLVIGHSIHYLLATAAEKENCPRVTVALCPMVVETRYTSPFDVNLGKL